MSGWVKRRSDVLGNEKRRIEWTIIHVGEKKKKNVEAQGKKKQVGDVAGIHACGVRKL